MGRYVTQRLMLAGVTLVMVSVLVFSLLRVVVPFFYADAVDIIVGEYGHTDPARADALREEYGLSGNLIGQYFQATAELPLDRSPATMKLVESTVDRWYSYLYMTGSNILSPDGTKAVFNDAGGQKALRPNSAVARPNTSPAPQGVKRCCSQRGTAS